VKVDYNVNETHAGKPKGRVHVPFRMSQSGLDEIDRLAVLETKGVRSKMIRKLLSEALDRRRRAQ
jgi:metal-responsive CopG/Arc/MetJ family transcriptional regulator